MVVWTILDHFGPVHFPTVLRPRPISSSVPLSILGSHCSSRLAETLRMQWIWSTALQFPNAVVLSVVGRRSAQMSAKERKWAQTQVQGLKSAERKVQRKFRNLLIFFWLSFFSEIWWDGVQWVSHMCSMRVVKHNGCDKRCVSGMSAPSSMMACFSVLFILCHLIWHRHFVVTWMEIPLHDNLQGRAWRNTWRKVQRKARRKGRWKLRRKKRSEKRGEKFYRRKTAVWDLSLFSFRSRGLVGNPLSWPLSLEIWQCRRLSLSLSA